MFRVCGGATVPALRPHESRPSFLRGDSPLSVFPSSNPNSVKAVAPVLPADVSAARLLAAFRRQGLYAQLAGDGLGTWRISPEPYWISRNEQAFFERLGPALSAFYRSLNRLYYQSLKTPRLAWVHRYLDQGKPEALVEFGRMRRMRDHLPGVLRPDLFAVERGFIASELDAVPGGFGLTAAFQSAYGGQWDTVVGGADGIVRGFARMAGAGMRVAIVVSDESAEYRPEMTYVARMLNAHGTAARAITPAELLFSEAGLSVAGADGPEPIDVVYRFFELFDLKNIPKSDLMLYAVKKGLVRMTPPPKAFLEEKSAMALWHHPSLDAWWRDDLGAETAALLHGIFPRTWLLDPAEVPPHAVIPGFTLAGRPVRDWRDLFSAGQRDRRLVIKPSGFSERAWGSRGVVVGHDRSSEAWAAAVEDALRAFPTVPHVIQDFHTARRDELVYFDEPTQSIRPLSGRTRFSPYYFTSGDEVVLGGVLATSCPLDKKLIHGMTDAVLAPCALRPDDSPAASSVTGREDS